jgi:peptide-methionine (S)-S-oxide reductase
MALFFHPQKLLLPRPGEALPGRAERMPVAPRHAVLGTPMTEPFANGLEAAMFGMGCFWGAERLFWQLPGVYSTAVGYAGGETPNPNYEVACSGLTNHAEVVQLKYDPAVVSYDKLLKIFWDNHNPTTLNSQGPDVGSQYRSVIFFHTPEQEAAAKASKDQLSTSGRWKTPIVTQIVPAQTFWKAEDYHQQYLKKRGLESCHM